MTLHSIDKLALPGTGRGDFGDAQGDGGKHSFDAGDGGVYGDGDGDGSQLDPFEFEILIVEMCVSQMYLLMQVLNQGE